MAEFTSADSCRQFEQTVKHKTRYFHDEQVRSVRTAGVRVPSSPASSGVSRWGPEDSLLPEFPDLDGF